MIEDAHRQRAEVPVVNHAPHRTHLHGALLLPPGPASEGIILEDLQINEAGKNQGNPREQDSGYNEKMASGKWPHVPWQSIDPK